MGEDGRGGGKQPQNRRQGAEQVPAGGASSGATCPVVGIGASAGGLDVFSRLLRALPQHTGMALVLVQHLDPRQESMLPDLLSRHSAMPVSEAANGTRLEPDHVYVMPAGVTLVVRDGAIRLTKRPAPPVQVLPVDTLFKSLAKSCGSLAIGVVLSGTGSDGALGLGAIKEAGGLTLAQDPDSAEYEGMPRASIDAGVVDTVLDPEGIAAELVRLRGLRTDLGSAQRPQADAAQKVDEESLRAILSLVRDSTGLDLAQYRRTTLLRRVSRRMLLEGVSTMKEYLQCLEERPPEVERLYRDILVNMTEFFRDPDALEALNSEVLPKILKGKESEGSIRIWVPGCSKGQEAYSILITLVEFLQGQPSAPEIQMFASDVNEHDVEFARAGVYPDAVSREVSPERLARFFVQVPGGYQIDRSIRELCVFAVHDVTKDPPFSKLDLVSFRNVLIYMERPLQKRILQILHYALEPGGFLLLGSSETTGPESTLYSVVDQKHRIYQRKPGPGKLLAALAPSAGDLGFASRGKTAEREPGFDVLAEAEKVVQGGYQPSGILVTADLDVLQFRGHVGPYLDPIEGPPEFKLPRMLAPGLASTVDAAIREAAKTKVAAKRRGTTPGRDGERRDVDVEAVPIAAPTGEAYYLVLFRERLMDAARPKQQTKPGEARVADTSEESELRRELAEAREQLNTIVSEREDANSDLRAAGERLQSSNEELRTINEEFQTAQEELQSTNEELTTLNDELRNRNSELGRLADDLNNVIEGVEIPILILDADLRIRRFTPQSESILSVVPTDVGRRVTDLNLKVDAPDFKERVRDVLRDGEPSETEVQSADGRWYSMRIRPYRTGEGATEGVVVAFIDIEELKKSAASAQSAREHAEAVVETVREPLLTLTEDLQVSEANDAFYQTFSVSPKETLGRSVYELGDRQWDFPELRSLLEQVLPGDNEFADLVVERDFPRVGHRVMELYARRVRDVHRPPSILLAVVDITDRTRGTRLSTALSSISVTIGATLEFDQILERVLQEAATVLGAQSAAVIVQQDGGAWVTKNAYGLPRSLIDRELDTKRLPVPERSETLAPMILGEADVATYVSNLGIETDVASILVVPLTLREATVGFVSFHYRSPDADLGDAERDFVQRLGTLLSLAFENAKLYATQREIAETLQGALLTVPARIPGIDFGYLYRSASSSAAVGGDFYDLFELDGGRIGLLLGDVSGKGVRAATLTALVKNTIRTLAYENESPAAVIAKANSVIFRATPTSLFVTVMFCILDPSTGRLVYCSAGHTRSIVKKAEGAAVELLVVGSSLAGAFEALEFEDGEAMLEKGDALILYTDGVTEARRDGDLFGEERLVEFVAGMKRTTPRKVPEVIFDEVLRYTNGELSDDVAILAVARSDKG